MKKYLAMLLVILMALGMFGGAACAEEAGTGLTNDLIILFTSDAHCGIDQGFGYAGVAAVRDAYLAKGYNVILADDGDHVQGEPIGTMTDGEAPIKIMNAVGYDVATLGNHEFDYGVDQAIALTEMADFPYTSCNFNYNGELVFNKYVMFDVENIKVAFVGISTPKTYASSSILNFMDDEGNLVYDFMQDDTGEKLYTCVQEAVDEARAEGADYVIAMAHLGNEAECTPYTYADVLSNTTGIDAMIDGHSHDTDQVWMINKDGEDVVRSACGTKLEGIGYVIISADGSIETGVNLWKNEISMPDLLNINNDITAAIADASGDLDAALSEVVAHTDVDLVINDPNNVDANGKNLRIVRSQETNLGDLCADAYRWNSNTDIAFVNGGGVRADIKAGDITRNQILSVHPFGNSMCVCTASGQEILDALEWSVHSCPGEFGGFLQVSGMTFEVHTYIESSVVMDENGMFVGVDGERRIKNLKIGGEDVDPEKMYTVASHDYELLSYGDGYTTFLDNEYTQNSVMIDNQVLINYIINGLGGSVGAEYSDVYGDGRIVFVDEAPAD